MAIKDESHCFALDQSLSSGISGLLFLEVIFTVISKITEKDVWEKKWGEERKGEERRGEESREEERFKGLISVLIYLFPESKFLKSPADSVLNSRTVSLRPVFFNVIFQHCG